jgi:hypothetical protein
MLEALTATMARRPLKPRQGAAVRRPQPAIPAVRPDVIVDFQVERGLLFVVLKNIGSSSAWQVVTRFDCVFHGSGGRTSVPGLALFRGVGFMPPGKQFVQLVDPLSAYYSRREPLRITATVSYVDRDGRTYQERMPHDLDVYRELDDILRD